MKTSFLAAAAATAMLVAAPAIAAPAARTTTHPAATSPAASSQQQMHKRSSAKRMNHTSHRRHVSRMDQPRYDRSATYRNEWNRPTNSGFAPLDFAGNVVGGAIGTAGAIAGTAVGTAGAVAAAPFGGGPYGYSNAYAYDTSNANAYAYDTSGDFTPGYAEPGYRYDGTALQYSSNYAARNGFVCQPGTWYTNSFGQRQLCQ